MGNIERKKSTIPWSPKQLSPMFLSSLKILKTVAYEDYDYIILLKVF